MPINHPARRGLFQSVAVRSLSTVIALLILALTPHSGNQAEAVTIFLDNDPFVIGTGGAPRTTITSPANFAGGLTGTIIVGANAGDNLQAASVEFQIDGEALAIDSAAPYEISLDTTLYPAGQHVLRARARDAKGSLSAWSAVTVSFDGVRDLPLGFTKDESWTVGLSSATAFAAAPDGRMFVAEQGGALRVVSNGVLLPAPFVQLTVDATGERGLVGVTLHPNFAVNGWVYVYYTTQVGGTHNRISRFVANGDVADVSGETVLIELPALSAATNHNGGALHFGIDDRLYVGVGENAQRELAQDLTHPFGKLLRFNDNGTIPADNPFFASQTGLAQAIWASGLRNPFTFAVQPESGRIHINDVGELTWEEINFGAAGANYGWPASEGPDNLTGGVSAPIFAYNHNPANPPGTGAGGFFTGFAIAGGAFYPFAGNFPSAYRGNYFFADFVSRFIARLDMANSNAVYAFSSVADNPVDMLVGTDGALYVLTRGGITRISAP
jgi:glucose/arabinose dehydrogenase